MKNDPTMQQITVDGYTFWTNSGFKPEELEVELINGAPTLKLKKPQSGHPPVNLR
jgi:hypothetical protein